MYGVLTRSKGVLDSVSMRTGCGRGGGLGAFDCFFELDRNDLAAFVVPKADDSRGDSSTELLRELRAPKLPESGTFDVGALCRANADLASDAANVAADLGGYMPARALLGIPGDFASVWGLGGTGRLCAA